MVPGITLLPPGLVSPCLRRFSPLTAASMSRAGHRGGEFPAEESAYLMLILEMSWPRSGSGVVCCWELLEIGIAS